MIIYYELSEKFYSKKKNSSTFMRKIFMAIEEKVEASHPDIECDLFVLVYFMQGIKLVY